MRHRQEKKIAAGDLGCYDGPPIRNCPLGERYRENAIVGSQRLALALKYAGLRP